MENTSSEPIEINNNNGISIDNNETVLALVTKIKEASDDDRLIFYLSQFTTLLLDNEKYYLHELASSLIDARIVELLLSKVCFKFLFLL